MSLLRPVRFTNAKLSAAESPYTFFIPHDLETAENSVAGTHVTRLLRFAELSSPPRNRRFPPPFALSPAKAYTHPTWFLRLSDEALLNCRPASLRACWTGYLPKA